MSKRLPLATMSRACQFSEATQCGNVVFANRNARQWATKHRQSNMQTKTSLRLAGAVLAIAGLSACAQGPYGGGTYMSADSQRALVGAGAGAVAAKAFDEDVGTGAVLGAAAGALCDDAGVCAQ